MFCLAKAKRKMLVCKEEVYMKALRLLILGLFGLSMLAAGYQILPSASAADLFSKVQCGTDIPKALIGGLMGNERSSSIEARHKALGLKDL